RSSSALGLSSINVEFDWKTNVYVARQLVQERLTAAAGSLPAGIKPTVMPISSIMGQILLVGMYRQPGPHGGVLAEIEHTTYLAELVVDPAGEQVSVYLWNPRDEAQRRLENPAAWEPVSATAAPVTLTWGSGKEEALILTPQETTREGEAMSFSGQG